ncbi:hypothetical protein Ddye_008554 [Dipteronia dyeriana]|uniref:Putative plant transposon protein domain-containing protein n=1 Tax=Dipteronia dyeriana TaxID=168575 RepID=A0AAD9XA29_9ROSI|nr:hypothetical protein Ddye_008554 [Dipteronia dyeriana]
MAELFLVLLHVESAIFTFTFDVILLVLKEYRSVNRREKIQGKESCKWNAFIGSVLDHSLTTKDATQEECKVSSPEKRKVRSSSRETQQLVRNRDYGRRMEKLNDVHIIFERGMHLVELKDTPIPMTVGQRGWQNFVSIPTDVSVSLVKEFYTSMIPKAMKEGSAVLLRDIPFMINATKIKAHFGMSNYPKFRKGYRCRHNTKSSLAMMLRGIDDGVWEHGHMLKQSELPQELVIWNLFNTFSLLPTIHRTTISEPRADLLSCIQDQMKIDIG